jgi:hypothetical protein
VFSVERVCTSYEKMMKITALNNPHYAKISVNKGHDGLIFQTKISAEK